MTTIGYRFHPREFPMLDVRLRVLGNVRGVDPGRQRRGVNDAAFKLWFVLRDRVRGTTRLFGYTWAAPDREGARQPMASCSRRRRRGAICSSPDCRKRGW
jgi:hypothetical protein